MLQERDGAIRHRAGGSKRIGAKTGGELEENEMTINVLQSDIDSGDSYNGFACSVALALNRQLPGGPWHVGIAGIYRITAGGKPYANRSHNLPEEPAGWIGIFDTAGRGRVAPFSFELPGLLTNNL